MRTPNSLQTRLQSLVQASTRDMGPKDVILAPKSRRDLIWQDPVPAGNASYDVESVKAQIKDSGLTLQEMVETVGERLYYRGTDERRSEWIEDSFGAAKKLGSEQARTTQQVLAIYEYFRFIWYVSC